MNPADSLAEFLPPYLAEVEELLASARTNLVTADAAARDGQPHPRAIRELFRAIHTIKGLSAMVEIEPIVAVTHLMETALRIADASAGRLELAAFDVLHGALTSVQQQVQAVAAGKPATAAPPALIEALEELTATRRAPPPSPTAVALPLEPKLLAKLTASDKEQLAQGVAAGQRAVRLDFTPSQERAARALNINTVRERLGALGEIVKVLPLTAAVSEVSQGGLFFAILLLTSADDARLAEAAIAVESTLQLLAVAGAPRDPPRTATALEADLEEEEPVRQGVVRVEAQRLDDAMDRVGALIVSRSRLLRAVDALKAGGADTRALSQILSENGRLLRDMRGSILRIRMVRVTEVLERLPLMVRGLRRTTGKQVALQVDAGNAELDKSVGDRLFPAIVHLVRNAIDHAIESAEERLRQGKPAEGTLRIDVHERSNSQLELSVSDDGRGVDAEAVAARAGVPVPATEAALLELLCRPGLSTRSEVTTTSGRGMGMDIVRRIAVDQLGGELRMQTHPGAGTTFTLRVPLTISIVDAFIFECGQERYAAPVASVEELLELDRVKLLRGPSPGAGIANGLIERRGAAVPVLDLAHLLGGPRSPDALKAIVVRHAGEPVAFAVEKLVSQQEIVIRPLEDPLVRVRGLAGATDLGDGRPVLVVDLIALGASAGSAAASGRS